MYSFCRVAILMVFFAASFFGQGANAQYQHVPDRCPEPCNIGATHVSPDYQRLTVPIRIRNGDNGQYLMLDGRSVSTQPLIEDDHRFQWVLVRTNRSNTAPGDLDAITRDNGFSQDALYKLVNLHESLVLRRSGASSIKASATYPFHEQYFVFRKNPADGSFMLYSPDTTAKDQGLDYPPSVSVDATNSTFATMPALMVPAGQNYIQAQQGADFARPGFSWHFDEAPDPLDLARLTIRKVEIFKPSTGTDSDTDWAIMGAEIVAGFAGGWASTKIDDMIAKKLLQKLADEGVERAVKEVAENAAKKAAEEAAKKSFKESVDTWAQREFKTQIAPAVMQGSISRRLAAGTTYIAAAPFRAGWWATKKGGRYVGRKAIKLARDQASKIAKLVKRTKDVELTLAAEIAVSLKGKNLAQKKAAKKFYKRKVKPYMKEVIGEGYRPQAIVGSSPAARTPGEDDGIISAQGGEIGELTALLAALETEWGGDRQYFASLARKITEELREIDPNIAVTTGPSGYKNYFPLDYVPEQEVYRTLFDGAEDSDAYDAYLRDLKAERKAVAAAQSNRPSDLKLRRCRLSMSDEEVAAAKRCRPIDLLLNQDDQGMSDEEIAAELRGVRKRLNDAEQKEFDLRTLEERISEITSFQRRIEFSKNPSLVLADKRIATHKYSYDISDETYGECFDSKEYSIPSSKGPFGRFASAQVARDIADEVASLSGVVTGDVTGTSAKFVVAMAAFDIATGGIGSIATEFKKLSGRSDDQVKIFVDSTHVWPSGGSGFRDMGKDNRRDRVDVEYIFRRGDTVSINLREDDSEKFLGGGSDFLGSLKVTSTHLFDRESYDTIYIFSDAEGSLYTVDLTLEPFYAPTPAEAEREIRHWNDCRTVEKQAEANGFAVAVEKLRIEGRLALLEEKGESALETFDTAALWADQKCGDGSYRYMPRGEWRVGRYDEFGGRDRSVTWTNTFSGFQNLSSDSVGEGLIVTPTETGVWNTRNWSSMYYGKQWELLDGVDRNGNYEGHMGWSEPRLHFGTGDDQRSPFIEPVKQSDQSCEVYALMYGEEGRLGSLGPEFKTPSEQRGDEARIDEKLAKDPKVIKEKAELAAYIQEKGADDPYISPKREALQNTIGVRRNQIKSKQREEQRTSYTYAVQNERSFALRDDETSGGTKTRMYRIADKLSPEFQAVDFLNSFYDTYPKSQSNVEANLHLGASGPAKLWMEKISATPGGRADEGNRLESDAVIQEIKQTITGSWEVGPYLKQRSSNQKPQRANPEEKAVWLFTENGGFISQPEGDFWFTPTVEGYWKYIGDQRIEVNTRAPIRIALPKDVGQVTDTAFQNLGTSFIVKMQQTPRDPTKFNGFFVQNTNDLSEDTPGRKIVWSEKLHPGQTPYEMPEKYFATTMDLLVKQSLKDGSTIPEAFRKLAATNTAAMTAKLIDLQELKAASPCTRENWKTEIRPWEFNDPGYTALRGKWRVGQYSPSGEKQFEWNYNVGRAPMWFHSEEKWRELGITFSGTYKSERPFNWEFLEIRQADAGRDAYGRPKKVVRNGYQQEWNFRGDEDDASYSPEVTIDTRLDGGFYLYKNGDVAPMTAISVDVARDPETGKAVMKLRDGYSPWVKKNGLSLQKIDTMPRMEASAGDFGCTGSTVYLSDLTGEGTGSTYDINFIYHKNGDKEFYLTKPDGTLFLWGLQDADRTKYTYEYDKKIVTGAEMAELCGKRLDLNRTDFWTRTNGIQNRKGVFQQEELYDLEGQDRFEIENFGLEGLKVFTKFEDDRNYSRYLTLSPGGHGNLSVTKGGKAVLLTQDNQCYGFLEPWRNSKYRVGTGFEPEIKQTDAITARESCGESITGKRYGDQFASVQMTNSGSEPLYIYRLDERGDIIGSDGTKEPRSASYDSRVGFSRYDGVYRLELLEAGKSIKIMTRVGHAYKALKKSTRNFRMVMVDDPNYGDGRQIEVERWSGEDEACFGKFKVTDISEEIVFSDEHSDAEFWVVLRERDFKRREEKRIANNLSVLSDTDTAANTVMENAAQGTPVGIVAKAVDGDAADTITYSANTTWFKIDAVTGEVVASGAPPDREKYESVSFDITATSSDGSVAIETFTVQIGDADEFDVGEIDTYDDFEVSESMPVGGDGWSDATFFATDDDATDTVTYSLSESSDSAFTIDPKSGRVTTTALLDYETETQHNVVVIARSTDSSQSSRAVTFKVVDVSEFKIGELSDTDPTPNTVSENATEGMLVGVTAFAEDADGTATITYSTRSHYYQVDPKTGVVKTNRSFDRIDLEYAVGRHRNSLQNKEFREAQGLTVTATSSDSSSSFIRYDIEVLDANEFDVQDLRDVDYAENLVSEAAMVGTPVGVTAKADDFDVSPVVTYRLSETAGGRFAIDPVTGVVSLAGVLDYETTKQHTITLVAMSEDSSVTLDVDILITDANEFVVGAVSDADPEPNVVPENNTEWGLRIGVMASAIDRDDDAEVTYSLRGNYSDGSPWSWSGTNGQSEYSRAPLLIDPKTGIITANVGDWTQTFDFESQPFVTFDIIATSSDGSVSVSPVAVAVTNINDNAVADLVDANGAPNSVREDVAVGTPIGITASAIDPDGDPVTYRIIGDRYNDGRYAIDPVTGVITTSRVDAERNINPSIQVEATSSDGSTVYKTFGMTVEDVNENPINSYLYDTDDTRNHTTADAAIGWRVGLQLKTSDPDLTDDVNYHLTDDAGGLFAINPRTGDVTVAKSLLRNETDIHTIEVTAISDDGSSTSNSYEIAVSQINDFGITAVVDVDPRPNEVNEAGRPRNAEFYDNQIYTEVGITAMADDPDFNDTVTYELTIDAPWIDTNTEAGQEEWQEFQEMMYINHTTGVVMNRWLDRELVETVAGVITATSTDGSSSSMPFSLNVFDVDEFRTGQVSDIDEAPNTVLETASIGTPVGITGFAEDKDVSATISYSLREDADGRFAIDPQTGVVYVAADLDLEAPGAVNSHGVYVEAVSSDGTGAIRYYSIDVTDVDEFSLGELIDINNLPNQVDATAPSGTEIGITVFAADDDFTDSAGYRIEEVTGINNDGNASPFQLNGDGVIIVWHSHRFDIDVSPQVFIKVVAESGRSPDAISTREQTFVVDLIGVKADPPEEKWYDNPQGDRVESSYSAVASSDFEYCRALDEDINSPSTYNNEGAYFDCLDSYLPEVPAEITQSAELTCAQQFELQPEESERFGKVTITNAHTSTIEIREILSSGRVRYAATLEPSQTSDILTKYDGRNTDPKRGVVFVGIDASGTCVGAGKPRESENRFTFGTPGTFQENADGLGVQVGNHDNNAAAARWFQNPQGSRTESDYPALREADKNACIARDDDVSSPETYNNEDVYFDCLEASMAAQEKWYQNPQGQLSDSDFASVSQADRETCQAIDDDQYSISFNNETDYFDCLAAAASTPNAAVAGEEKWYANPQGKLTESDFPNVSEADRQVCIAIDENADVPETYNNEDAYFECLQSYSAASSNDVPAVETASGAIAEHLVRDGCFDEKTPSVFLSDKPTKVTIQNIGSSPLHIFWVNYEGQNVNYDGAPEAQAIVGPGDDWIGETYRGFVYTALREDGSCAGVAKPKESQNSYEF